MILCSKQRFVFIFHFIPGVNRKKPRNNIYFFSSFTCLFVAFSYCASRGFPRVHGYLVILVSFDFSGDV